MNKEQSPIRDAEFRNPALGGSSADNLLGRAPPVGYTEEWEQFLSREKPPELPENGLSAVIFRIGKEYFALSSLAVGQVTTMRLVHRIPHQKKRILRGCVNVNGQLRLFISLMSLLELDDAPDLSNRDGREGLNPMIVVEREGEVWTFAITEVLGIHQLDLSEMKNVPVTIAKSSANYLKGVIAWKDHSIGILDEELLFFSLRKGLL